ncbi:MAG: isochorismatase family protein [Chlamydiales bacterium]|nr:isochorismatase family protein [Chlamydiales bacterium]
MFIEKETCGLWIVDVQERLFPHIDRSCEVLEQICYMLEAARLLHIPIFVTEQAPDKLGETVEPIKKRLPEGQLIYSKTTFSGFYDPVVRLAVEKLPVKTWILVGIEAHICVLQTAKDLLAAKKNVVALNDAVSSRSLFDFSTAIGELRDAGARISSTETVIYESIRDAASEEFKECFSLIKAHA